MRLKVSRSKNAAPPYVTKTVYEGKNKGLLQKSLKRKKNFLKSLMVKILTNGPNNISKNLTSRKKTSNVRSSSGSNRLNSSQQTSSVLSMAAICSCSSFTIRWSWIRYAPAFQRNINSHTI